MRCHQCGSSDVDVDPARSDVVCMECGTVLSDVSIVSEVNFSEQPSGLSSVVGQFVSLSGSRGLSSSAKRGVGVGGVSSAGYGRDSREQTLSVGRKLLQQLSDALRLRPVHVDQAYGHFKLAVQHNFIQGRRTRYVAAACMYVACRKSKTPHLLLDLADALQVNLYMLGATLLKLIRVLHISLPIVDPSLYIHRFAAQLQLQPNQPLPGAQSASHHKDAARGASTHMVAMTALRLVSRMKRDWLQVGRRPSGICGACLLIACRMHGYRRSQREILDVVRICDATLRRRLLEFVSTPSSQLTFVEFEQRNAADEGVEPTAVADDGHNPPAYTRAVESEQEADRAAQRRTEVAAQLAAKGILDADVERQWEREVNQLLQLPAFTQLDDKQPVSIDAELSLRHLINEHCRTRDKAPAAASHAVKVDGDASELVISLDADSCMNVEEVRRILSQQRAAALREDRTAADVKPSPDNSNHDSSSTPAVGHTTHSDHGSSANSSTASPLSQAAVADLSYLDDAELDEYILTAEEAAFRTAMWDDTHADYIRAQLDKKQQLLEANSGAASSQDSQIEAQTNGGERGVGAVGAGGRSGSGVHGGGPGHFGSINARRKEKLGQSAFFRSATGVHVGASGLQMSDAKPALSDASAATGLGSGTLTSDVSAMLSASEIASSATTAAYLTLSAHLPAREQRQQQTAYQQQRRVSGKINYQRLKGLLDSTASHEEAGSACAPQQGGSVVQSDQRGAETEDERQHLPDEQASIKRRRAKFDLESEGGREHRKQPRSDQHAAIAATEVDGEEEEEEEEDDEDDEVDVDEPSAATLMRDAFVDSYGSDEDS